MRQAVQQIPKVYDALVKKSNERRFSMPSDIHIGALLKTLVASKPKGNFLELGTGMGLSLSWMVDGMCANGTLTTIDNDEELIQIAKSYFEDDQRLNIICVDGSQWIKEYDGPTFDLIFADAWPGKYSELDQLLNLVSVGGFYVIDDMNPQENWPEGHDKNVDQLVSYLDNRIDFNVTKMNWSTGIIIAVKKNSN